tara:strand:- start:72 stop:242 length:171 start_codon:yes stop_codon:yes gene_type:complete
VVVSVDLVAKMECVAKMQQPAEVIQLVMVDYMVVGLVVLVITVITLNLYKKVAAAA